MKIQVRLHFATAASAQSLTSRLTIPGPGVTKGVGVCSPAKGIHFICNYSLIITDKTESPEAESNT